MYLPEREVSPKPSNDWPLPEDLPCILVQHESVSMESVDVHGAFEDFRLKQTLISHVLNILVFKLGVFLWSFCHWAQNQPPSCCLLVSSGTAWLASETLNSNFFFLFGAQLLHMTVDISFCCQNIIKKTWGVERATISPFNHYSICNENFMQCVIFS